MENKTKIGIGVVLLAGVGYYLYTKSKSSMPNVSNTTVNEPKKTGFDREKASRELTVLFFPFLNKKKQPEKTSFVIDVKTGLQMAVSSPQFEAQRIPLTQLSLYNKFLVGLNGILDDSDAEFIVNIYKKYAQAGSDSKFKPNLDAEIRIEKIQKKYPVALKEFDLGS